MSPQLTSRRLARSIFSVLFLASINSGITQAQVVPDGTLPTNVEQLEMLRKITGGERVGDNLFHSFEEFSIPAGMEAIFENAADIQNIFTRITGSEASFIDGLLQTAGGANFFLVNPNGIVFGENAQIDVGGSFIATTANSIEFADGTSFLASGDEPKVTLTISVPIGLGFYSNNGSITVNGTGNQITNDSSFVPVEFSQIPTRISVSEDQTLALVGNRINFNGGVVSTEGGDINLISIESGSVGINQSENGLTLLDNVVTQYQDINLNQESLVNASGKKVGTISLSGQNINLSDASVVLAQNQGDSTNGSIDIKASESINLSGSSPNGNIASAIRTETLNNMGEGANINIATPKLSLQDAARIQAFTFSDAIGGSVEIETSETINLNNSFINASTRGKGDAGTLNLSTSQLQLINSANISSSSIRGDGGNGGDVTVNAYFIEISGVSEFSRSNISTSSFTTGNAGDLTINTSQLKIRDGASVGAASFNNGNAGNLIINASESIDISGKNPIFQGSSNSESSIRTAVQIGRGSRLPKVPTGDAGNLIVNTPILNITQEGVISVENQGTGKTGELTINANTLKLDQSGRITAAASSGLGGEIQLNTQNLNITNDSQITAEAGGDGNGGNININTTNLTAKKNNNITASANLGEGGNITINADSLSLNNQDAIAATSVSADGGNIQLNTDRLQLDNDSQISTSAEGLGDGGNITINSNIFTAFNNSEVTANAIEGDGGNITINTKGYFVSDDFVISASSEFGLDGTVTINTLSSDIEKDLKQSEPNISDLSELIAKTCLSPQRSRSSLTRGSTRGLPLNPDSEYRNLDFTLTGVGSLHPIPDDESRNLEQNLDTPEEEAIIPATQMIRTEDGEIYLIASLQEAKDLICSEK